MKKVNPRKTYAFKEEVAFLKQQMLVFKAQPVKLSGILVFYEDVS